MEGWINTGVSQWNSTTNAIPVRFQSGTGSIIQVFVGRPDTLKQVTGITYRDGSM